MRSLKMRTLSVLVMTSMMALPLMVDANPQDPPLITQSVATSNSMPYIADDLVHDLNNDPILMNGVNVMAYQDDFDKQLSDPLYYSYHPY